MSMNMSFHLHLIQVDLCTIDLMMQRHVSFGKSKHLRQMVLQGCLSLIETICVACECGLIGLTNIDNLAA